MSVSFSRQDAIQHALECLKRSILDRNLTLADVVARLSTSAGTARPSETSPREAAAAAASRRRAEMLAEMTRLEGEGRVREAAALVANKFARDREDPVEVESLTRRLRRWRAKEKRTLSVCEANKSL